MGARVLALFTGDISPDDRVVLMRHGFRLFLLGHVLWACGWLAPVGLVGFAQAGEVKEVKRELQDHIRQVESKLSTLTIAVQRGAAVAERAAMETELRRLDQEIFEIEARTQELARAGVQAERIYGQRLAELRGERSRVENRLRGFMMRNPMATSELQ